MSLDHLDLLATDADAFVSAIANGPSDAPIAGCPGWTLTDLGAHLGGVQRWARAAILTGAVPHLDPADDPVPSEPAALAAWVRAGADRLLATLHSVDPSAPTWHPFPVEPKVAGLWRRRQAQEASVHRWDAERAIGMQPTIDTEFAADGVDEYWTVMLPRVVSRESLTVPRSVIAVRLTDTGGSWVIDGREGTVVLAAAGVEPAAEISGPALEVLLRLWGRPIPDGSVQIAGDETAAGEWLALGGP
ncbi:MAG: maleylpyruvate isomerase family mycothiol-dependent enzyme [Actinomycetota bacterium]|nr:maleylpyruvate isomerase family mycothiol-dependent enzyme [Actinomycetota bacterium]